MRSSTGVAMSNNLAGTALSFFEYRHRFLWHRPLRRKHFIFGANGIFVGVSGSSRNMSGIKSKHLPMEGAWFFLKQ